MDSTEMAKYPHYITKIDLGLCSDGVNHVYRYDFREPEQRHTNNRRSETKAKAILLSGIHLRGWDFIANAPAPLGTMWLDVPAGEVET